MKTFLIFIGVWFVAAVVNGLLTGIAITICNNSSYVHLFGSIFLSGVFSFVFSVPLVGIVWIAAVIAQSNGQRGHALFQTILASTLLVAVAGAIFFTLVLGNAIEQAKFAAGFCIIISAMTGVLTFRSKLKTYA